MPSFDVVSEVDAHELTNAIDQTNREVTTRFDFKGTNARVEHDGDAITIIAPAEFQVKQILEILQTRMTKRSIDINCLELANPVESGQETRLMISVQQGIDKDNARTLMKVVRDSKMKVQVQQQGDQLRVSGKSRDDLQSVIGLLKTAPCKTPLQYRNFRD